MNGALTEQDRRYLDLAYEEARKGAAEGGVPIAAVLAAGEEIWACGHNRRVQEGDPIAHGEMDCIRRAGRRRNYDGTTIYSSASPCFMCAGAIVMLGIPRVVAVTVESMAGPGRFLRGHGVELLTTEHEGCTSLLDDFVKRERDVILEDGGAYTRRRLGEY
jgi:cytosine deaminase